MVWRDGRDLIENDVDVYAQRITAAGTIAPGWPQDGLAIRSSPGVEIPLDILADGAGGAYVVWMDYRRFESSFDVYLQKVTGDGRIAPGWPEQGFAVCTTPRYQNLPRLAPDRAGGVFVVWQDEDPFIDSDVDLYAQRITAQGALAPGWPLNGLPVCDVAADQIAYGVLEDGVGGLFVVWSDHRPNPIGGSDIYGIRLTAEGTVAPGWLPGGTPICTAASHQSQQWKDPVSDGQGGFIAFWTDRRNQAPFNEADIYAQRMTGDGKVASGWPKDGIPICTAGELQWNADAVADGLGGAIVAWDDYRNYDESASDIYAQHVMADGQVALGWPVNGLALTRELGFQYRPRLVANGAGGAFAVYETTYPLRPTSGSDIHRQEVTSAGGLIHGAKGTVVCSEGSERTWHEMISDGAGGMIVVYGDSRDPLGTSWDIYAQWVPGSRPAPVDLRVAGTGALRTLSWSLSEPAPGSAWTVLRARGGGEFEEAARLVADAGVQMSWWDDSPPGGVLRYRVRRETENPNYRTESGEVTWPPQAKAFALSRPAGAGRAVELELTGAAAGPVEIRVYDVQGRLVLERRSTLGDASDVLRLDVAADLRSRGAGIYFARAQDSTGQPTEPLKLVLLK